MIKKIVKEFTKGRLKGIPRLNTLESILSEYRIDYTIKTDPITVSHNVIVQFNPEVKPREVLGAHYDVWGSSVGINDNTVAVATLINLIPKLKKTKLPLDVVFFDKEETGMTGASFYIKDTGLDNIKKKNGVLILDVIGYGNVLAFSGGNENYYFHKFNLENKCMLTQELPSDNIVFNSKGITATLLVVVPGKDLKLRWNDNPEVCILKPNAEFYESFHNRKYDNNIELINWDLVDIIEKELERIYG